MSEPTTPSTSRAWFWPLFLVGLLVMCVVIQLILVVVAVSDPRQHVEADYYAKGLAWDEHMAEARASAQLGWSVTWELKPVAGGARILEVTLTDIAGKPLEGATARCWARHRANLANKLESELSETEPGRYLGAFSMRREGHWELQLEVVRDGQRFVADHVLDSRGGPL